MTKIKDLYVGMTLSSDGFCRECGAPLQVTVVAAEEGWDRSNLYRYGKYNIETGLINMALHYRCPKAKWYNKHSEWTSSRILDNKK